MQRRRATGHVLLDAPTRDGWRATLRVPDVGGPRQHCRRCALCVRGPPVDGAPVLDPGPPRECRGPVQESSARTRTRQRHQPQHKGVVEPRLYRQALARIPPLRGGRPRYDAPPRPADRARSTYPVPHTLLRALPPGQGKGRGVYQASGAARVHHGATEAGPRKKAARDTKRSRSRSRSRARASEAPGARSTLVRTREGRRFPLGVAARVTTPRLHPVLHHEHELDHPQIADLVL